jgi:hypothetical protein
MSLTEVTTWGDLLVALKQLTTKHLEQPIQIQIHHPDDSHVFELQRSVCLGTVDEHELRYVRSVVDNRRHGDELILSTDYNGHAEDGVVAYDGFGDEAKAIYPDGHDESADWTGPAQKIADTLTLDAAELHAQIAVRRAKQMP